MTKNIFLIICSLAFLGCATVTVKNGNGNFVIERLALKKNDSIEHTRKAADQYCQKYKKPATIVNENTVYQGPLDERVNEMLNQSTRNLYASKKDYKTTIEFKCE